MIVGYAQSGHVDDAMNLFVEMTERDVVSWTSMIAVYVQNGYVDEVVELFERMLKRDEVF